MQYRLSPSAYFGSPTESKRIRRLARVAPIVACHRRIEVFLFLRYDISTVVTEQLSCPWAGKYPAHIEDSNVI